MVEVIKTPIGEFEADELFFLLDETCGGPIGIFLSRQNLRALKELHEGWPQENFPELKTYIKNDEIIIRYL